MAKQKKTHAQATPAGFGEPIVFGWSAENEEETTRVRPKVRPDELRSPYEAAMQRADELLRKMTVEEKAMQLSAMYPMGLLGKDGPLQNQLARQLQHGIGHICALGTFGHKSPVAVAKTVNAIQRYLVTETRLGIPAIFHNEAANGVVAAGFTAFPTPIGLAATWDTEGVHEMADLLRLQMRSVGLLQALAPVMDLARDARWGRVHETFGEDPYLVTAMGVAFVRGLQGDSLHEGVLACAKHFLGYSMTEGGQNMAATVVGSRELYDVYARPFEAAMRLAGLGSVMASYAELDGVPIHLSRETLTALLRERLGFAGTVLSDYLGVAWAHTRQRAAASAEEVGALALLAGLDVELPSIVGYGPALAQTVESGKLSAAQLDESVRRVLRDKFALGLFDAPYVPEEPAEIQAIASDGDDLSRRLAAESVTLLKNEGNVLPLSRDIEKIAVIGPYADSALIGFPCYTYPAALALVRAMLTGGENTMAGSGTSGTMPLEAKAAIFAEMKDVMNVDLDDYVRSHYPAVSLAEALRELLPNAEVSAISGTDVMPSEPTDIVAAVAAAKDADFVILYVGGKAAWAGHDRTEGEGVDCANIDLPPQQLELIEAITDLGKPTVAVVAMGRPQGLAPVIDRLPAVITAYFGGPHQGEALADALCGVTNPSGKLPFTVPRHSGQVPIHHAQKTGSGYRRTQADIHKGYADMPSTPLFPFGHGLSYTKFDYGSLLLEKDSVDVSGALQASITITNSGKQRGTEIVQLYAADTATGVTLPAQQLIGFARIALEPGASKTVSFEVPLRLLAYTGLSGELVMEPGPVGLSAGSSSNDIRSSATLHVTGKTRVVGRDERAFLSVAAVSPT